MRWFTNTWVHYLNLNLKTFVNSAYDIEQWFTNTWVQTSA